MDFPWKVGVLYTAHKVLHIYVVFLLPSSNNAYGPLLSSYCHQAMMHMDHPLQQLYIQDNYPKRVQRSPKGTEGPPSPSQKLEEEREAP